MWLQVPEAMENVLWQGPLEPATEEAVERLSREWVERGDKADPRDEIRDLPVVSIGHPEVWLLAQLYPPEKMPPMLRAKLEEADFYLARLACSFRPRRDELEIEWARFLAHLVPDDTGQQPVAFDLHPLQVTQEIRRNVKVSLSPTVKFMELEAAVGGVEFGFEYPELQPLVTAAGAGEVTGSWDYEEAKGMRVQGIKWMHLLVKTPKGMTSGKAVLDLAADVTVRGSRLAVLAFRDRKKAEAHLTVRLWG